MWRHQASHTSIEARAPLEDLSSLSNASLPSRAAEHSSPLLCFHHFISFHYRSQSLVWAVKGHKQTRHAVFDLLCAAEASWTKLMMMAIPCHIEHCLVGAAGRLLQCLFSMPTCNHSKLMPQQLFLIICFPLFPLLATTRIVPLIRVEEIALSSANVSSTFLTSTTTAAASTDRLNSRHLI